MSRLPSHYLGMLCLTVVVIEVPILKTLCYLAIRPTCTNWRSQRAISPVPRSTRRKARTILQP